MKTNNAIQHTLPPALRYRRMAMVLAALFSACFSLLTPATAQTITSAVPGFISYQGKVLNSSGGLVGAGTPVNRTVTFRIWDHASNTLVGNLLYSEQQTVTISEGEFSVLVGQGVVTALSPLGYSEAAKGPPTITVSSLSVFAGPSRYLGVTVDDGTLAADNEITPRQQIVSSAYALRAKYAESLGSNGATSLTALDSGNVGIGNGNPLVKLQISGGSDANLGSTTGFMLLGDTTATNVVFDDNEIQARNNGAAANLILNEAGGNVGIGNASPTAKLDVTGGIKATGAGGYTFNTNDLDGGLFSPADGMITLNTNGTEKVRVDGSGNVSIGTTTPKQTLDVSGGINVRGTHIVFDSATAVINWGPSGSLFFRTLTTQGAIGGYVDRMAIDSSGKVGIGTASPRSILDIAPATATTDGIRVGKWTDTVSRYIGITDQAAGFTFPTTGGFSGIEFGGPASTAEGFLAFHTHDTNSSSGERMRIDNIGNVGIGATTPADKVHVLGTTQTRLRIESSDTSYAGIITKNSTKEFFTGIGIAGSNWQVFDNTANAIRLYVSTDGNVGVGTTAATYAKLVVSGGPSQTGLVATYLQPGSTSVLTTTHGPHVFSIYATGGIRTDDGLYISSDARIKTIEGLSDSAADLHSLLGIEVTNYHFRDKVAKGDSLQKKVVAQQVEKVYPQAVSKVTNVVPDIYSTAAFKDGWIELKTDLKKGERVRLTDDKATDVFEVLEVKKDKFRTAFEPDGDQVFVYGREVKDFRVVDYEAISMLNVSATQQLKKEMDAEIKALKEENSSLKDQLSAQAKQLAAIEAKDKARDTADKARDAKIAAIEKALESAGKAAVRTASLKKAE